MHTWCACSAPRARIGCYWLDSGPQLPSVSFCQTPYAWGGEAWLSGLVITEDVSSHSHHCRHPSTVLTPITSFVYLDPAPTFILQSPAHVHGSCCTDTECTKAAGGVIAGEAHVSSGASRHRLWDCSFRIKHQNSF